MKSERNALVVLAIIAIFIIQHANTEVEVDYRLPKTISPISYDITLEPPLNGQDKIFNGTVNINASVAVATKDIVFHTESIDMDKIVVTSEKAELHVENSTYDNITGKHTIRLNEELPEGKIISIAITYRGTLSDDLMGLYANSYVDDNGKTKWLVSTHLEPLGARKLFPCFDEPALKSTFQISVNRPVEYTALSNTPLISSGPVVDGRVWDTFEQTPIMSTYLVALVVSDFKSLNDPKNNYSIWARPNAVNDTKYVLSVMAPLVKFYENAIKHPYQLTKLDMVTVPKFKTIGMENWGLVIMKEQRILVNEISSTIEDKQKIATIISHEIAHQWFGNLVTPSWWRYLWLSEGISNYFQYHGLAQIKPKWGLESQFVIEEQHYGLFADGFGYSHSMSKEVNSPAEINNIFDGITYCKSGSIIRMLAKTFGSTVFYNALHDFLEARKYSYTTPDHLSEAFENQINSTGVKLKTSVKTIMESWSTQAGYPVILVTIANGKANLHQERFLLFNSTEAPINKTWWIPITWTSKSNADFDATSPKYWLSESDESIELNTSDDEWVIFNIQQSGYYRVNYDPDSWNRIINFLKSKDFEQIHEINRAAIMDDLLNFGRNGYVDYGISLSATLYLQNETNYIPWVPVLNALNVANNWIKGTECQDLFKTHMKTILTSVFEYLGIEEKTDDSYYDKLLRNQIVEWACYYGVASCISKSSQIFANWKQKKLSLSVPIRFHSIIYCTAIKYGSVDDWDFLWNQYLVTNVSTEKAAMLSGLECSSNAEVNQRLLMKAITKDSGISSEESEDVVASILHKTISAEAGMHFVGQNYPQMAKYYGSIAPLKNFAMIITGHMMAEKPIPKLREVIEKYKSNLSPILKTLEHGLRTMKNQQNWYAAQGPKLFKWLNETYGLP